MSRWTAAATTLLLCPIAGAQPQQPAAPEIRSEPGNIVVLDESVASFAVGQWSPAVYQVLSTASAASRPKFKYEPIWAARLNGSGKVALSQAELPVTRIGDAVYKNFRLSFVVDLATSDTQDKAIAALRESGRLDDAVRQSLQPGDVDVLRVKSVTFSMPDLRAYCQSASLYQPAVDFPSTAREVVVRVDIRGTSNLKACLAAMPDFILHFKADYAVRSATTNAIVFEMKNLKDTALFRALSGLGNVAYVQRHAYQGLVYESVKTVSLETITEDPSTARQRLSDELLASSADVTDDEMTWSDEKWKQVYHGDDLKPTVLKELLSKTFHKESGKDQWKIATSAQAGGSASLFDILKVGGNASGSYSSDELHEYLRVNSIEVDIKGDVIIPKSIDLVSVNTAALTDARRTVVVDRRIGKAADRPPVQGEVLLSRAPGSLPRTAAQ